MRAKHSSGVDAKVRRCKKRFCHHTRPCWKAIRIAKVQTIPPNDIETSLSNNKHFTVNRAYAHTLTNPDQVKDKLYDVLDSIISTPSKDMLILLGDFIELVHTHKQSLPSTKPKQDVLYASPISKNMS